DPRQSRPGPRCSTGHARSAHAAGRCPLHHRRPRGRRPQGDADHPSGRGGRRLRPPLLRPPAARAGGRLPAVPGRGGRSAQAGGLLHDAGHRGHGDPHPAHQPGRRQGAAGHDGAAADQPPARLPHLRQGRRVPAAEPGDRARAHRDPLRRREAHLSQAGPDQHPDPARPRALRALRPVHPLLPAGRRRPVHRAVRAGRPGAGRDLPGRAVRVLLLGQHHADLPGRGADQRPVPLPRPPVRPAQRGQRLRALLVGLLDAHRLPARQGHPPPGRRRPGGQRGVDLRQGPLRVPLRQRQPAADHPAGPGRRRHPAAGLVAGGLGRGRRRAAGGARGRRGRRAARWPADRRGRLRLREVRPRGVGHQRRRRAGAGPFGRGTGVPGCRGCRHRPRPRWGHLRRAERRARGAARRLRAGGGVADRLPAAAPCRAHEQPPGLRPGALRHPRRGEAAGHGADHRARRGGPLAAGARRRHLGRSGGRGPAPAGRGGPCRGAAGGGA
ncbi:MAG: NADH-ubiquinone oxidoreductase chain G, partial [uncultured Blastococcus sp.]